MEKSGGIDCVQVQARGVSECQATVCEADLLVGDDSQQRTARYHHPNIFESSTHGLVVMTLHRSAGERSWVRIPAGVFSSCA